MHGFQFSTLSDSEDRECTGTGCHKRLNILNFKEKFVTEVMAGNDLRESLIRLANLLYDLQNRKPTYVPPPVFRGD